MLGDRHDEVAGRGLRIGRGEDEAVRR